MPNLHLANFSLYLNCYVFNVERWMFCHRQRRELPTVDDAWDVLSTVKGGPGSGSSPVVG